MRKLILSFLPMIANFVLPELEARAAKSKSKLDDFGVGLVKAVVEVCADGKIGLTEVIRAGVIILDKLGDVLADDVRIPGWVVPRLREVLNELRGFIIAPSEAM